MKAIRYSDIPATATVPAWNTRSMGPNFQRNHCVWNTGNTLAGVPAE
jgi:hypothetical protein